MALTVDQAQKNYDNICADNERRLDAIEKKIVERQQAGLKHEDLDDQLANTLTPARLSEGHALRTLNNVKEAAAAEQAESAEKEKAASDVILKKMKDKAFREYVAAGGNPGAFDVVWPGIHERLIEATIIQEMTSKERAPIIRSL